MLRQGAVGKAKPLYWICFIDDIDDTTGVERMESEVTYPNRNLGSEPYRHSRPAQAYPWDVQHLPCGDCLDSPVLGQCAGAKLNTIVVDVVPRWPEVSRRRY